VSLIGAPILSNMKRRSFLKYSAAAFVTTVSMSPLSQSAQAATLLESTQIADALNPSGICVAGIRMIPVAGGEYKVWTKRIGSGSVKVLLLHGGPGFPHDHLEAMESSYRRRGLRCTTTTSSVLVTPMFPTIRHSGLFLRYLSEVEEVRRGLGLDHFVLYGHSWDGILAMEYALNYQQHLRGLVISNMAAGTQSYLRRTASLKAQLLSPESLARFNVMEAAKDYEFPAYTRIVMEELYPQMICRLKPWPEPVTRAFRLGNEKICNQMQGKSEFEVTGNLKDWERWHRLKEIKVRALTIGSNHDEMDPADMRKMATLMRNATSAIYPNGSHMSLWDEQTIYFRHLLAFMRSV
jgi:proline iminopeptidase